MIASERIPSHQRYKLIREARSIMFKGERERERKKRNIFDGKKRKKFLTLIPRCLVLLVIVYDLQRSLLVVQRVQDLVQRWISLLLVQKHDQLIEIDRVRFPLGAGNEVRKKPSSLSFFLFDYRSHDTILTWIGTIPLCRFEGRFCGTTRRKRRR